MSGYLYPERAKTFWVFDLPSSGKTTVANELANLFRSKGKCVLVLDAGLLKMSINNDIIMEPSRAKVYLSRIAHFAKIANKQGILVIVAASTRLKALRKTVQNIIGPDYCRFIYISTPEAACAARHRRESTVSNRQLLSRPEIAFEKPSFEGNAIALHIDTSTISRQEQSLVLAGFVEQKLNKWREERGQESQ